MHYLKRKQLDFLQLDYNLCFNVLALKISEDPKTLRHILQTLNCCKTTTSNEKLQLFEYQIY